MRKLLMAVAGAVVLSAACALGLTSCGGGGGGGGSTSGPEWSVPSEIADASFDEGAATGYGSCSIDTSGANDGYVAFAGNSGARLKVLISMGERSYNYDLPNDGTPIVCPLNMGSGTYECRVMQNTSGANYVAIGTKTVTANFDEEEPFLHPNVFCDYGESSDCVQKARELTADAQNEGDVVQAVYSFITSNIQYDEAKAAAVADVTGYAPDPDETLRTGRGICFDYASLAAAMFRSLGIPCKIITGYVSPDGIYHAWNMVKIDGSWQAAHFSIDPNEWTRVDLTFAASSSGNKFIGDGTEYEDRYEY